MTTPALSGFSIDSFKSGISNGTIEPARSSLFKLSFDTKMGYTSTPTDLNNVEYLCRATAIPGLTITPIEKQYLGRTVKIPGDITFTELNITIVNDTGYEVRNALESWMAAINSHEENTRHFGAQFGKETTDITLTILDRAGADASGGAYNFKDAWPTTIDPIELSWDTASDIEEFSATFAYQYYTIG